MEKKIVSSGQILASADWVSKDIPGGEDNKEKVKGIGRRDFLKKIPLFGAGLALGLSALAETDETPKARKLAGERVEPQAVVCNAGTCNSGYYDPRYRIVCNAGTCNAGY